MKQLWRFLLCGLDSDAWQAPPAGPVRKFLELNEDTETPPAPTPRQYRWPSSWALDRTEDRTEVKKRSKSLSLLRGQPAISPSFRQSISTSWNFRPLSQIPDWITPLAFLLLTLQMANDGASWLSYSRKPIPESLLLFIYRLSIGSAPPGNAD